MASKGLIPPYPNRVVITNARYQAASVIFNHASTFGPIVVWDVNERLQPERGLTLKRVTDDQYLIEDVIQKGANSGAFVLATALAEGASLTGSTNATLWTIKPVPGNEGFFTITATSSSNETYFWTLDAFGPDRPVFLSATELTNASQWRITPQK